MFLESVKRFFICRQIHTAQFYTSYKVVARIFSAMIAFNTFVCMYVRMP
jgi:hypothetical protein